MSNIVAEGARYAGRTVRTGVATVGQGGVALTETTVLHMPTGGSGGIKPRDMDLSTQGEVDPGCTTLDSNGVATCIRFQPLILFIGGAYDAKTFTGCPVLNGVFRRYEAEFSGVQDIGYGTWTAETQLTAIARHWHMQGQKIVLAGHSYGGQIAVRVAGALSASGIETELLVTLDPVGREGALPRPVGVKRWLNIYVDYTDAQLGGFSYMMATKGLPANLVGYIGKPWMSAPGADVNLVSPEKTPDMHARADQFFDEFRNEVSAVR